MWCGCVADLSLLFSPCRKYFAPVELLIFFSRLFLLLLLLIVECVFCLPFAHSYAMAMYRRPTTMVHIMPYYAKYLALCFAHLKWQDIFRAQIYTRALYWAYIIFCSIECTPMLPYTPHSHTLYRHCEVVDEGREHICEVIFATDSIKINLSPSKLS